MNPKNKKGQTIKITADGYNIRKGEEFDITILTDWFKDFEEADDFVAYVKRSNGELSMVQTIDGEKIFYASGWADGIEDFEILEIAKKYNCTANWLYKLKS